MQQEQQDGEEEKEGEGKGTLGEAAGAEIARLTPTVFPPRRPKTYNLKKGQVGVGRGEGLSLIHI